MARIIYVEDDELMGEVVKSILTDAGHLIGVIGHGTLAFETITFKRPELVILDCNLPGIDGVEILTRLRRISEFHLTPVLMLSGRRDALQIERAMAAGANDYLTKPFTPEELIQRVEHVLEMTAFARSQRFGSGQTSSTSRP